MCPQCPVVIVQQSTYDGCGCVLGRCDDCHVSTGFSGEDTGGGEGEGFTQQDHGEGERGVLDGAQHSLVFCLQEIIFHREKATELSRAIETLKEDIRYPFLLWVHGGLPVCRSLGIVCCSSCLN